MENSTDIKTDSNGDKSRKRIAFKIVQTCFNVSFHISVSFIAIYMTFICCRAGVDRAMSWHAWLCTIGYQFLMAEALMTFYPHNIWSKKLTRETQKTCHWVLQALGSAAVVAGIITEYASRQNSSKNHISSTHSIIGFIGLIFTLLGMLNGMFLTWPEDLKQSANHVYIKLAHNITGITAYILGTVALFYGYNKSFMVENTHEYLLLWMQAFAIKSIVVPLLGALRTLFNMFWGACFKRNEK